MISALELSKDKKVGMYTDLHLIALKMARTGWRTTTGALVRHHEDVVNLARVDVFKKKLTFF